MVGAINLYAAAPHAFSKEIKVLLLDMVVGVDLALERFSHRDEQQEVQQALERSERLYRQLTESIHDVIWRIDAQSLTTRYVSPAVQQLLGYRPQDLEGLPVQITLHDDSLDWLAAIRSLAAGDRQQQAGGKAPYRVDEVQQRHSDGSSTWSEITTTLGSHELTGELEYYCVSRNITAASGLNPSWSGWPTTTPSPISPTAPTSTACSSRCCAPPTAGTSPWPACCWAWITSRPSTTRSATKPGMPFCARSPSA